eukprot:gnl/Dysnectes_brevis/158_a185_8001.p1 GENE.gnl/Dysnectes_brevis/158_a185_8001~~gnl/Dysnectes_brevis/158_a185_8001.p1  ORF type:complete len:168 (+),score=6.21 gnl/Dysnectes_brevis/158_a185_8001:73-576(+)
MEPTQPIGKHHPALNIPDEFSDEESQPFDDTFPEITSSTHTKTFKEDPPSFSIITSEQTIGDSTIFAVFQSQIGSSQILAKSIPSTSSTPLIDGVVVLIDAATGSNLPVGVISDSFGPIDSPYYVISIIEGMDALERETPLYVMNASRGEAEIEVAVADEASEPDLI